ncbi:MAG TPA: GNAT family N-acetyltransferase [Armatimonadaceae bacterium]|nr:GNAT family N-acetyltransferase [Armatimonadaceae bacterium]
MVIRFEAAEEGDAEALARVQKAAFDSQVPPERPDLGGPPGYDAPEWQRETMREAPYFRVLRDGEIVGGIVLRLPEPGHVHVERVFLHPDHHGAGIGTRAFAWLEATHPHVALWTLRTPAFHTRNQRLYERLGYRRTGEVEVFPGFSLVEYEKRIGDGDGGLRPGRGG